ncbi:hypothetical protein [Streptomyces curacoi]|uniref:Uncharacterized protein n=1 Tax=Streptomyces curacoi TaxID=146536 RepID=A0A117P0N7_9ACTN|nr:hypothetical protein AQI70_29595 [Streptomyces curacoi]
MLAALSAGSAVGGLLNGAVAWRSAAGTRLPRQAAGLGLALCGAGLAQGLGALTLAVAVAGLFVSPLITTAYLVADEAAAPDARVRAGDWVNTAVNAGSTASGGVLRGDRRGDAGDGDGDGGGGGAGVRRTRGTEASVPLA